MRAETVHLLIATLICAAIGEGIALLLLAVFMQLF